MSIIRCWISRVAHRNIGADFEVVAATAFSALGQALPGGQVQTPLVPAVEDTPGALAPRREQNRSPGVPWPPEFPINDVSHPMGRKTTQYAAYV